MSVTPLLCGFVVKWKQLLAHFFSLHGEPWNTWWRYVVLLCLVSITLALPSLPLSLLAQHTQLFSCFGPFHSWIRCGHSRKMRADTCMVLSWEGPRGIFCWFRCTLQCCPNLRWRLFCQYQLNHQYNTATGTNASAPLPRNRGKISWTPRSPSKIPLPFCLNLPLLKCILRQRSQIPVDNWPNNLHSRSTLGPLSFPLCCL